MVFLVATLCAFAGLAHAQAVVNETQETATLYVDVVNGNDSNPGTESAPFQTIAKSVAVAEANNQNSIGTHVYINPGLYHENINLTGNQQDTALPETYEAATPGTVLITGADQYTNWTQSSGNSSIYSTPWTYNFGLCPALTGQAPPQTDIVLRREMVFIDGTSLEQVLSMSQMLEGTFYVDDSGQQLYIWPPSGTNLSAADVELADRPQLWNISNKNGVVLRGLTFEYSPDCKGQGSVDVINTTSQNILFDTDNFLWNDAGGLHFSQASNYTVENVISNHNGAVGMEMYDTLNALVQNTTADYNNWRGEQGEYFDWAEGGINPYGLSNGTFTNINTDWNFSAGIHWDTNFANINASNVNARNNVFHGLQLERNTGPMNLTSMTVCNNANEALTANGTTTSAGGVTLRDSEGVTLANSFIYGNGNTQLNVIGEPGGIPVLDWLTAQIITVFNENFTSLGNVFESSDITQNTFQDGTLGGDDWILFQTTLSSGQNTWWNSNTSTPFLLPVPTNDTSTSFTGWQSATGQDLNSTFGQPGGNQQAQCTVAPDGPDLWAVINVPTLTLDPSGQATATYTYIPIGGFDGGTLNLSLDGISEVPGLSATLTPSALPNASGATVFSATATTAIAPGTYQFSVLANAGPTTRMVEAFLTVPQTSLRFSPSMTLNYGSVEQGELSAPQTLSITNVGSTPVTNLLVGTAPSSFPYTSTCGSTLAAGASCSLTITFAPNSGATYNSPLTITDSDPTTPQTITLAGQGIAAAMLSQSAYLLSYGSVVYGLNSVQAVTLTNTGTVSASLSTATIGGTNPSSYSQTNNCGTTLAAGASCVYTITFAPQALGQLQATLTIPDNTVAGASTINTTGNGQTAVTVNPLALTFGSVAVTNTASKTTTITNAGNALPVAFVLSDNVNYTQTNTCGGAVPANGSCTVTVTFAPTNIGTFNATLTISDSDPTSPQVATLVGTGTAAVTVISATPAPLTFLNVAWNVSSSKTVTVKNNGVVTAFFSGITLTDANDYTQTNTCGTSLAPKGSCTVTVTLTPQALGSLPATLTIADNNSAGANTVALSGTGITSVTLNPLSLTFGNVVDGSGLTKTSTLTNAGNALSITIALSDSVDYSQTNTCGGVVPAGGSCAISVTFAPKATGALNATLSVTDADPASPQVVALTGTGLADITTVTLTPSTLAYGNVVWGLTSSKTVTVKNSGSVNAVIGALTFTGASDYTQTNNCPATLTAGTTCTVTVTFAPTAIGALNGALSIADNTSAGSSIISMTGTGITSITLNPATLAFGSVELGTNSTKTTTLTNAGNALPVSITLTDNVNYSETNTCGATVPAGGSCVITIIFTPRSVGALNTTVNIVDGDPSSPQSVTITGSGLSAATTVTLTPSSLTMGSVVWGLSLSKTTTVKNTGTVNATIGAFTFSGAPDYAQTNNCPATLAPKGTCTVTVTFTPQALGALNGSLSIADNTAAGFNAVTLTGTGKTSITVSPFSLVFGRQKVGTSSAPKTVTFTNAGNAISLAISLGGANSQDWSYTTTCGATVPAHGSCTVSTTFSPLVTGSLAANVVFTDADPSGPQLAAMTGSGS